MNYHNMSINNKGHLEIGGCDLVDLASEYGTPLYVLDEELVVDRAEQYLQALKGLPEYEIAYASKAFISLGMAKLIANLGLCIDVASGGELYIVLKAGFPAERIYFHGNNKSIEELKQALNANVGRIVVDNLYELELLSKLAAESNRTANILIRLTPGIDAYTHTYIRTGQLDSKFGISLAHDQAFEAVKLAAQLRNIELKGVHCHIGSQIFDVSSYPVAVDLMMRFISKVKKEGIELRELNLGGGLGIRYIPNDQPVSIGDFGELLTKSLMQAAQKYNIKIPKIIVEPGRSIVGEAGTTLYRIGAIKEIRGGRTYAAVDGGMTDNIRVALYQARYHGAAANKAASENEKLYTIVGKSCESSDILISDIYLPKLEAGDILAVFVTGAYNYSMANNYNAIPRSPVVIAYKGQSELLIERETYQDLIRLHKIPARWCKNEF